MFQIKQFTQDTLKPSFKFNSHFYVLIITLSLINGLHGVRRVLIDEKTVPTRLTEQLLEELLVVDPCYTADLRHLSLSSCFPVDKVGRDADGQLASQLLVLET